MIDEATKPGNVEHLVFGFLFLTFPSQKMLGPVHSFNVPTTSTLEKLNGKIYLSWFASVKLSMITWKRIKVKYH